LFFAGEHTSFAWQGYMNGAIETGRRAAAEVDAAHRLGAVRRD
jgi:monoamine oxidase